MSIFHPSRAGTRGGKDQFNWNTVKSDKDRECYLGHSVMAPTGRWQEGKDLTWYAKDRENEQQIKSAEFRSAKKVEEDALMAALGMKIMPPPGAPTVSTPQRPVIKREPQSVSIKNEPMTPAIHNDSRNSKRHHQNKTHDNQRKEDRRRRRQLKATASDEEKNDWSENDEEDLMDADYDDGDKTKHSIQQNMTEKELDEFLIDLVKKHGLKTIQRSLKSKKDKKEHKRKHSSSSASPSAASESEEEKEEKKKEKKHKHKKKHSQKEESKSTKRHRTSSSSPSSKKDRSKHH